MAKPGKSFSKHAIERMLRDANVAICDRDKTILLIAAENRSERERVERLQKQLGKERAGYEDRLRLLDKICDDEMLRVRKLQSIIKVLEATIFCLTKKSLQIDTAAGGSLAKCLQVIDEAYKPSNQGLSQGSALAGNGGFGGSATKPQA